MTHPKNSPAQDDRVWADNLQRIRRLGSGAVPELIALLGEPSWARRRQVIAELATLGDSAIEALATLIESERSNETVNAAAMDALAASVGNANARLLSLALHPSPAVAADAAQLLGRRREREAVPTLAKLATGEDDNVAVAAIEALGRIGGRGAVESLIAVVRSGNFFRTFPAIDVLGRSGDRRGVAPLSALLQDSRYTLEAMRALSRTVDRTSVPPLAAILGHASPTHVRVAAAALADLVDAYQERYGDECVIRVAIEQSAPPNALRSLTKALSGADNAERVAIARILGMLRNPEAVSVLSSLVEGPSSVARAAVLALEALGPQLKTELVALLSTGESARRAVVLPLVSSEMNASDEIVRCFKDPDGNVRALAAQALARTAALRCVSALFPLLEDPNARVVQAAVGAIQALGGAETEALTLASARSSNPRVQREALRIVRFFGYVSALPIALSLLDSDDERLREAAILALSSIEEPEAMNALLRQADSLDKKTRAMVMRALGQSSRTDSVVEALTAGAHDPDPWVRYYAAQALGKLGVIEALPTLTELLTDTATQVRVSAVEALSHMPCDEAFRALEHAATSEEGDLRRAAVLGFGTLKRIDAIPILVAALESADPGTRLVATSALGQFETERAVSALGRAANDPDESVRMTAIGLLSEMRSREATLSLVRLLPEYRSDDRVRLALSAASPGRIEGIVFALRDADDETATVLSSALVRMRTPEASQALLDGFSLENVAARKAIATALGVLGSREAIEALAAAARSDPNAEVRRVSALAAAQA